jgi:hypothetical protein
MRASCAEPSAFAASDPPPEFDHAQSIKRSACSMNQPGTMRSCAQHHIIFPPLIECTFCSWALSFPRPPQIVFDNTPTGISTQLHYGRSDAKAPGAKLNRRENSVTMRSLSISSRSIARPAGNGQDGSCKRSDAAQVMGYMRHNNKTVWENAAGRPIIDGIRVKGVSKWNVERR